MEVKIENITCQTDRKIKGGKEFGTVDDLKLRNINTDIAGAVISRYWKGIEGDNSNAVIVRQVGGEAGLPTEQRLEPNTVRIKQANKQGYIDCEIGGVADFSYPSSTTRRGRVQDNGNTCPALTAVGSELIYRIDSPYRIRKLTPMECWRLMDFSDQDFHRAEAVNSNTQLYKQAGNSIVRNVLVAIFGQMLPGKEDNYKKGA